MTKRYVSPKPQSQTVDRALQIVKMIAGQKHEMGVMEIARRLDVYPSVASRLLATLEYHGVLRKNRETSKYQLGAGLIELGTLAMQRFEIADLARQAMEGLGARTGETIFLMVLNQGAGVYIAKVSSPNPITVQSEVGQRGYPHTSAVGKALLAYLPETDLDQFIGERGLPYRTPNTITDTDEFKAHLAEIRKNGCAIDDEEGIPGVRCIGAPILDPSNYPIAAISICAPAFRTSLGKLLEWKPMLLKATKAISRHLGYSAVT